MKRRAKFLVGGLVILVALAYLIYAGVTQSLVYFVTPTELLAAPAPGKSYRLGGMVQPGSLKWEPKSLDLRFVLSDGQAAVPVRHVGPPPDLFAEGRGAVVEGAWSGEGYFRASSILAKHSEEYKAPHDGAAPGYQELLKTLRGSQAASDDRRAGDRLCADRDRPRRSRSGAPARPSLGARSGRLALVVSAERAAVGVWALITAALLLLAYAFLTFDFSIRYVAIEHQSRHAVLLPDHRGVGSAGRLHHPLGVDARALHLHRGAPLPAAPADALSLGAGGDAGRARLLPPRHGRARAALPAAPPGARGRARPQSAARGLRDDHAPGGALPRLHRLHGALRLRHRRALPSGAPARSGSPSRAAGPSWPGISSRWAS